MSRLHHGVGSRAVNRSRTKPTPYGISAGFEGGLSRGCRWIEGDDFTAAIRRGEDPYCGAPRRRGSPYCAEHRRRAIDRRAK